MGQDRGKFAIYQCPIHKVICISLSATAYVYKLVGEVPVPGVSSFTLANVSVGPHTYVARSFNGWESPDSNAVSTAAVPGAPGRLIVITITVPQ